MKKRVILALLSIVMVVASIVCLVACGETNNNTDKSFQNQEFVGFRKKIVTILKDNGIFVNDIDAKQKTASAKSGAKFTLAASSSSANAFDEIMAKPEYLVNSDDYDFALKQIFGMSLKMSLCLGDGISNYFGETTFFNIPVKIGDSYMSVSEDGNVNTVRAFYPAREDYDVEQFEQIDVTFTSNTNYSFSSLSIQESDEENLGSSKMFASGNAQKQFIMVQTYDDGVNGHVLYSPNGTTFYYTEKDADALNACLEVLGNDAFEVDETKFYANKENVKYTFTQEQNQALTDKYFKDIQSGSQTDEQRHGITTTTIGGMTVADGFFAASDNSTVEIPEGTEYLLNQFPVYDRKGNVTKLYIPKSVKGIVDIYDKKGQPLSTPRVVDVSEFRVELIVDSEQESDIKPFKSISVENGSSLFKSGSGHLRATDGRYICLVDAPITEFRFDMFTESTLYSLERPEEQGYTNLSISVESIDFDLDSDFTLDENAGWDWEYIYQITSPLITNLKTINLSGTYNDENYKLGMALSIANDVTINIDIADSWKFHGLPISYMFMSSDSRNHNVTVNLKGLMRIDEIDADSNINVTLNTEVPEILFETSNLAKPNAHRGDVDNIKIVYAKSPLTEEEMEHFSFNIHNYSDTSEMLVYIFYKTDNEIIRLTIPEKFMFDVTALAIPTESNVEVVLNSKIKYLVFPKEEFVSGISTLIFNGTQEQFENQVQIKSENDDYIFYLQDNSGKKTLYKGANAEQFYTVSINIFGEIIKKDVKPNESISILSSSLNLENGYIYFFMDNDGSGMLVNTTYYDEIWFNAKKEDTQYTLVRFKLEGQHDSNEFDSFYQNLYPIEYLGIEIQISIDTQIMHRDTYDEIRITGYINTNGRNEDDSIYITGEIRDLFDINTLFIYVRVSDLEEEQRTQNIRLKWSYDEDYNLIFGGIEEVNIDDPKKE